MELEWEEKIHGSGTIYQWHLKRNIGYSRRLTVATVTHVVTWWKVEFKLLNMPTQYFATEEEAKAMAVALVRLT